MPPPYPLTVRISDEEDHLLREIAKGTGRTVSEEVRMALRLYYVHSMLASLAEPGVEQELGGKAALEAKRALVAADLEELEVAAFGRYRSMSVSIPTEGGPALN